MRLSELIGRYMVNISTGEKMGILGNTDLYIDEQTGRIDSMIIFEHKPFFSRQRSRENVIPWDAVMKIGTDTVLLDLGFESNAYRPQK